jgi:hypothetical protein
VICHLMAGINVAHWRADCFGLVRPAGDLSSLMAGITVAHCRADCLGVVRPAGDLLSLAGRNVAHHRADYT